MSNKKDKYFLCYLRTGGGHLAPARSIAKYLSERHGAEIEPVLIDGLVESKKIARTIIEDGYRFLQGSAKWYYTFLYAVNKFPPIGYFNVILANYFIKPYIKRKIEEERPAKIVIFHFFLIMPVYQILKELELTIPVVTVITDPYTAHPLWFQKKQQKFIVFSERLKKYYLSRGVAEDRIAVFQFIIDEKFTTSLSREQIAAVQSNHGIDGRKKMVLIIGGGDGIPHGKTILENLLSAPIPVQLAIVCGKNEHLYSEALEFKKNFPELIVFGFIDFVYDLLNAADIVITKCGASTIMEILILKKIPVIIDYLWEQELGNMEFVRDHQLGIFEPDITKLPGIIRELISNQGYYETFQHNIERMNLKNGTNDVGEFLLTI